MREEEKPGTFMEYESGNNLADESQLGRTSTQPSAHLTSRRIQNVNRLDVGNHADLDKEDDSSGTISNSDVGPPLERAKTTIAFQANDVELPYNWGAWKKTLVLCVSILTVANSTVASGLASNSAPYFAAEFSITSTYLRVLPTSVFLLGYTIGPIVFGPMSEQFGRKIVMVLAFLFYTIWTMGCALAPNYPALVVFRFLAGIGAACPVVVVGGTCADIYGNPESRGRAMAIFMGATTFGPCAGPLISGYLSPINWRWSFWVGLIFAGVTLIPLLLVPETYSPVLLQRRARKLRKTPGNENLYAAHELEKQNVGHIMTVVLSRPIRMLFSEAIVLFISLYLSFVYGIFYMLFQSYAIIYEGTYGFSGGEEGLTFLTIGVGACFACGIYLYWDLVLRRARAAKKPWVEKEEMRRLPLACLGGPCFIVSCFWLGWTARKDIHWIVPILSGIPFGIGYLLIFMALLNYLVDAYKIFSASAMAAASMSRSLCGAVLPFAATPMYRNLGVPWACSLLGFLSCLMAVIPFIFVWKGEQIRARSKFCQLLIQKEKEDEEARRNKEARHAAAEGRVIDQGGDKTEAKEEV